MVPDRTNTNNRSKPNWSMRNPINTSGEILELEVKEYLHTKGIPFTHSPKGPRADIDFILHTGKEPLYIECHNQNGKGSEDEKIPHKIWKYWNKYGMKTIYIVKGKYNGFGKGVMEHIEWMGRTCNIQIHIISVNELKKVLNRVERKHNQFF